MDNNVNFIPPVMPVKKEYKPLEKREFAFAGLYLISAFLLVSMGLFGGFRLGFTIAYFVLLAVTTAYSIKRGSRVSVFTIICGLLSLAGSVSFALFSDYMINFFVMIMVIGLYVIYSIGLVNGFCHSVGSFKIIFDMVQDAFVRPFSNFSNVIGGIKATSAKSKRSLSGLIGFVIAIPFIAVIVALLSQSDVAFEGLIKMLGKNIGWYLFYLLLSLLVMPYLYSYSFANRHSEVLPNHKISGRIKVVPSSACISFLGAISVVYVVYLFSQLAYFFSAFKGILPSDYHYTASAFARRGFFEMFAVCVINVIVVSAATAIVNKKTLWLKLLSCFVSAFSVLMIVIAMQKMRLNISIYGLTKNRIVVTAFMVMMLVVLAFFILHIFAPKISYIQPIVIACSVILLALSFADVDARIAEYNISAYESGAIDTLDVDSLGDLSDSALPYIEKLIDSDDENISRDAMVVLGNRLFFSYDDYFENKKTDAFDSIRSYNLSQSNGILTIDDSKYSEQIYETAKLYADDEYFYNFEEKCFDSGSTQMQYNIETHCFDIRVHTNVIGID